MGNQAYFISFKDKKKESVMDSLNKIGKRNFGFISIQGLATFKKNFYPCNIKKGESYLLTYGDRYYQRDKEFLDEVDGITKRQCRVIDGEKVYWSLKDPSDLENYADIEDVEYDVEKYVILKENEEDKLLEEKYGIVRCNGGYIVTLKTINSNNYNEDSKSLTPSFDNKSSYYLNEDSVDSDDEIMVSDFSRYKDKSRVYIFNNTTNKYGFLHFEGVLDEYTDQSEKYEETSDNIDLALNSVARAFKNKDNVKINYIKKYSVKDFKQYAIDNNISLDNN